MLLQLFAVCSLSWALGTNSGSRLTQKSNGFRNNTFRKPIFVFLIMSGILIGVSTFLILNDSSETKPISVDPSNSVPKIEFDSSFYLRNFGSTTQVKLTYYKQFSAEEFVLPSTDDGGKVAKTYELLNQRLDFVRSNSFQLYMPQFISMLNVGDTCKLVFRSDKVKKLVYREGIRRGERTPMAVFEIYRPAYVYYFKKLSDTTIAGVSVKCLLKIEANYISPDIVRILSNINQTPSQESLVICYGQALVINPCRKVIRTSTSFTSDDSVDGELVLDRCPPSAVRGILSVNPLLAKMHQDLETSGSSTELIGDEEWHYREYSGSDLKFLELYSNSRVTSQPARTRMAAFNNEWRRFLEVMLRNVDNPRILNEQFYPLQPSAYVRSYNLFT